MELQPDDGPRSSLGIGLGSDDVVGPRWEFAEGIGKLARNMSGDHRKKTGRLTERISKAAKLAGVQAGIRKVEGTTFSEIPMGKPLVSNDWTARTLETRRLLIAISS
ncbi:hypothetical protein B296_00038742 [Ensete ventricosum]|uniref:Uncharacterized protein n=1 Tax=Ensete ventricosum TaxID=4639 RepID=A0A426X4I5_ENSVE|nr:hypothetical protein B296_00038742 [Ensete ventricosum]